MGDCAVLDDVHLVGEEKCLGRVVGDDETSTRKVSEVPGKHPTELHAGGHVESGEGLVEKQEIRIDDQRPGQGDPLRLTPGELRWLSPLETSEIETLQPASSSLHRLVTAHAAAAQSESDILEDRHMGKQQVVLEHNSDPTGLRRHEDIRRRLVESCAGQIDPTRIDRQKAGDRRHRGRFPRSVRAEQGNSRPGRNGKTQIDLKGISAAQTEVGFQPRP